MKFKKIKSKKNTFTTLISLTFIFLFLFLGSGGAFNLLADRGQKKENYYNDLYAEIIGGTREVSYEYKYGDGNGKVMVDIETDTEVIEGGKDKRSSLDSLQQALFFSVLTKKKPVVVIYDTDGRVGKYEYRIQQACEAAGVEYRRVKL